MVESLDLAILMRRSRILGAILRLAIILAVWLAVPAVALADDANEIGFAWLYRFTTIGLIAAAGTAIAMANPEIRELKGYWDETRKNAEAMKQVERHLEEGFPPPPPGWNPPSRRSRK
jgi:hypothetical protein